MVKREQIKCTLFAEKAWAFGVFCQKIFKKVTLGQKRACKIAEGLSSWMIGTMESETGTVYPKPVGS